MTANELLRILKQHGCLKLRQKGSHVIVGCGKCRASIPVHPGEDLGRGLLGRLERDLEPCLGKEWLKN